MKTHTFYRQANVAKPVAIDALFSRYPNADLASFETIRASAELAKTNGFEKGELVYAATIKVGEFPPKEEEGGGDTEAPSAPDDSAPDDAPEEKDDGGESPDAPDFGGGSDGGEGGEPKKMSTDEKMLHVLEQILHAVQGGGGPDDLGPGGPDDLAGGDLPDIGAPPAGGPAGPPHKAPLPPPVAPKAPMGGPAFSSIRVKASEVGNKAIIAEAKEAYPNYKVAKIQRSGSAEIKGKRYNLPENDVALVTLVKG